jgi:hypothetical protein
MSRRPARARRHGVQVRRPPMRRRPAEAPPEAADVGASMSQRVDERCTCGHRHPEHSIEGICYGCGGCLVDEAAEHNFVPCPCRQFVRQDVPAAPEAL